MGWARALALLGAVAVALPVRAESGLAGETPSSSATLLRARSPDVFANLDRPVIVRKSVHGDAATDRTSAASDLTYEPSLTARVLDRVDLDLRPNLFDQPESPQHSTIRGRAFSLSYLAGADRAHLRLRGGYRYGLPLDETRTDSLTDDELVLTTGGTFAVSVGPVAWLQLELDAFREVAGRQVMQFDAVPGLRFRIGHAAPVEFGAGCLATLKRTANASALEPKGFAGVAQVSARF